ncbi:hypothetical protein ERJ75_000542000 [Trypanosoma vivax]|nr:hypothetical protein ERJ75_001071500 [Trypanosoma vivax]KAH8615855.1 hypothetical protein ERJ75_000542000 [Trypanosoma vivax]
MWATRTENSWEGAVHGPSTFWNEGAKVTTVQLHNSMILALHSLKSCASVIDGVEKALKADSWNMRAVFIAERTEVCPLSNQLCMQPVSYKISGKPSGEVVTPTDGDAKRKTESLIGI